MIRDSNLITDSVRTSEEEEVVHQKTLVDQVLQNSFVTRCFHCIKIILHYITLSWCLVQGLVLLVLVP